MIDPAQTNYLIKVLTVLGLLFSVCLIAAAFWHAEKIADKISNYLNHRNHPSTVLASALLFVFFGLVLFGITGSSIKLGLDNSVFIHSDSELILGRPSSIRSDEWLLMTPSAIAQANHNPSFPVINKNIGEAGQNMLVIGMAGAPVKHITAFSKPATWGFYLFDLKRALAWYWWLPIFGGLLSLWAVLSLLAPNQWRIGFLGSLLFCLSPYVTAWSYWPAYSILFPCLMLYSLITILRTEGFVRIFCWSIVLGLSFSGFVLILYPPYQIALGYLFLFLGIGIVIRDKLYLKFNFYKIFGFIISLGLAATILLKWWTDAGPAIISMMNTVYPGQRAKLSGGDVSISVLLRGFTNLRSIYEIDGSYSNQSEISSFFYFFPSLLFLFGLRLWQKKIGIIQWILLIYLTYIVSFMLLGVPEWFAEYSLWGRIPGARADVALGLSYVMLVVTMLLPNAKNQHVFKVPVKIAVAMLSVFWCFLVTYAVSKMPYKSFGFASINIFLTFMFILLGSWWLALGVYRKFFVVSLVFSLFTIWTFNPISIAPTRLTVNSEFNSDSSRILVMSTQIPAMMLLACGRAVANGIFYYPQKKLWDRLFPDGSQTQVYNRFQHLIFLFEVLDTPFFKVESPSADVVMVKVDGNHFNFSMTGAGLLVVPTNQSGLIKTNKNLVYLSEKDGWSRYSISETEIK